MICVIVEKKNGKGVFTMKKNIALLLTAVLLVSLAACSQPSGNANSNSTAQTQTESSNTSSEISDSETSDSETSDNTSGYEWNEFKVAGQPLYFAVPADLDQSEGWVIHAYLKRDEKIVAVMATAGLESTDLDEATTELLTNYFSDGTQFMGAWYNQEDIPEIVEKLEGEKKTVNGMDTYYFDTKVHFDSDLAFIGYTFVTHDIPCAIIAMDLDDHAAKDAEWKDATEKELRERVDYMINHVEWRE